MIVLYIILRAMVRVTLRIFYKEFTVTGRHRLPAEGPLIVVANHPNTLMDPLVVGSLLRQQAGFLGNGSLFRNKALGALLRYFDVIPVYRKQDVRPGETMDNTDTFREARAYLAAGGTLLIFPEGTSYSEKKLRELRTGAARIALDFEQHQGFGGGLRIVPIALNYTAPTRFRTRLRIDIGAPIAVGDYREEYAGSEEKAMRSLTAEMSARLSERLVILEDPEEEKFLTQVERLYTDELLPESGVPALEAERALAGDIRRLHAQQPAVFAEMQRRVAEWIGRVEQMQMRTGFFRAQFRNLPPGLLWLAYLGIMIAGLPLFLAGLVTSWVPYWFPGWVAPRLSHEIEYHAPIMMVTGMFLFPLWYLLLALLAWLLLPVPGLYVLAGALALPALGAFALWYNSMAERFRGITGLLRADGRSPGVVGRLHAQRETLIRDLQAAFAAA